MQRPPGFGQSRFLMVRPPHEWINRVTQKHKAFVALGLSEEQKQAVTRFAELEFTRSALLLEGVSVTTQAVESIISSSREVGEVGSQVELVLAALRRLQASWSEPLTPESLLSLRYPLDSQVGGFRRTAVEPTAPYKPLPPEQVEVSIGSACHWFAALSFRELNPIEQASIAQLRMIEILPFDSLNRVIALLTASLFTLRSGLPPVIIKADRLRDYRSAIEEGARMNTQPMVELIAEAVEATLDEMISVVVELGGK
jgi:hypothetical protein